MASQSTSKIGTTSPMNKSPAPNVFAVQVSLLSVLTSSASLYNVSFLTVSPNYTQTLVGYAVS